MTGVRLAIMAVVAATALGLLPPASVPARAESLEDRLDDIQMSLDALQAESAARDADRSLADCQAAFASGATSCTMPRFCAEAINRADPGNTVTCHGYEFTKQMAPSAAPSAAQFMPMPGAYPFSACGLANCTNREKRCAESLGMDAASCRSPEKVPIAAQLSAAQQSATSYLDAAPDLAGRWRQINVDPQFLAWLQQADPLSGRKRQTMLTEAFNAGDAPRAAAFFRTYIAEATRAPSYTYIPTQQDREEVRACVATAGPDTTAIDCVMPTANRITSTMLQETGGPRRPAHPSQAAVMIEMAGLKCGMPADNPQAPVPPSAKPCLDAEARKVVTAIVTALRDYLASIIR